MIIHEGGLVPLVKEIVESLPHMDRDASVEMTLHTYDYDMFIDRVLFVDTSRDYVNSFSDHIQVTFEMPLGDYIHHVSTHKDLLEVTLKYKVIGAEFEERYQAVLQESIAIKDGVYNNNSQEELNKHMHKCVLQLMKKNIMDMRSRTINGVFKKTTLENVVKTLTVAAMNKYSTLFKVQPGIVKMIKPNNTRTYKHIIIPNGTPFNRFINDLQNGEYGIYNGGAGMYLQSNDGVEDIHVFPTHRPNLFAESEKQLQVVAVAADLLANTQATYVVDDTLIKIVVPSIDTIHLQSDNRIRDKGLAIHTVEADSVRSRPYSVNAEEIFTSDVLTQKRILDRSLDSGKTPVNQEATTNNHYKNRSKILANDGFIVTVEWYHSNARLLYPCMPVMFITEDYGEVVSYEGILQRVDFLVNNQNKSESAKLVIFLKREQGMTGTVGI